MFFLDGNAILRLKKQVIFNNFTGIMSMPFFRGIFLLFFCVSLNLLSQTGPAGVGSSATNVFWLKADKGTSSTVNATPISYWNDQSGNTVNVTQTVTAQQPSFATNVLNGFPGIEFDNTSGSAQADRMYAPDNAILDNTPGYSFFTTIKMNNIGTDARCIISKRTAVDTDEAFMLFFWNSNYFYLDVDGLGDRLNTSPATYTTNTGYIIDAIYDGGLTLNDRSKIYEGETLRKTAKETSTLVPDKASPLNVGCTHQSDARPFGGYISEVIIYTVTVNDAQRIIINNYLSAKYNIALASNDKYDGDNSGNGDYDFEVAGIGKESSGSNTSFSASVSGGLTISHNSGLDNGDYILAGHATALNTNISTDVGGMTGTNNARWLRIWYIDVTNTSTNINTNIEFDMSDGGMGSFTLGPHTNYVLLYRSGQSGNWTEMAVATATVGDRVQFNNIDLANDGYYTIGTKNFNLSPLPVELLSFDAVYNSGKVNVYWTTATEKNNDYFAIERSKDGITFETFAIIKAAGNSNMMMYYSETDYNPLSDISYYRLKQTDKDGKYSYSQTVAVNYRLKNDDINIYPNPADGFANIDLSALKGKEVLVVVRDMLGREFFSKIMIINENNKLILVGSESKLVSGTYFITASSDNRLYSRKLIVK